MRNILVIALCFFVSGCIREPVSPIPALTVESQTEPPERLLVFLPGRGDTEKHFERHSFLSTAHASPAIRASTKLIALDAHLGYYYKRLLTKRVKEDIFDQYPNTPTSLVGVSLGGFGALLLTHESPERITDCFLIAPFLGDKDVFEERVKNGDFETRPDDPPKTRATLRVWRLLLDHNRTSQIAIASGRDDEFAALYEYAQEKNPNIRIMWEDGGHTWKVWKKLWQRWLPEYEQYVQRNTLSSE